MKSIAIDDLSSNVHKRLDIIWKLNKRCNFDCSYCPSELHDNFSKWKDIKKYKTVIDKLIKTTNKRIWLTFTGGEPCLYPQFIELVKYCKEKGIYSVVVSSNASKSSDYYIELMKYADNIILSYHFEYQINTLKSIIAIKKSIEKKSMRVNVMMLPEHFEEAKDVIKSLKENNILYIIRRIRPSYLPNSKIVRPNQKGGSLKILDDGPDFSNDENYYSDNELEFFKIGHMSIFKNVLNFIETSDGIKKIEENVNDILARKDNKYKGWLCWSGINNIRIWSDGNVYNAACWNKKIGNIYKDLIITLEKQPHICEKAWCSCASNIKIKKIKDEKYRKYIRKDKN